MSDNSYDGKAYRERRTHGKVILRNWKMPVIVAIVWCLVWPFMGALALAAAVSAVPPKFSQIGQNAFVVAVVALLVFCLGCAVRALRARVVVTAEGLCVHNNLSTIRAAWSEVENIEEAQFFNSQALWNAVWYGVAVRIRGRRRSVRILASWSNDSEYAEAFAERLRSQA